jgi:hypothetical protein
MTTATSKMGQSCTTKGIYVGQDDRTFNRFNRLKPFSSVEFRRFYEGTNRVSSVAQDWDLTILRWGRTSIAYREWIWAIGLVRMRPSCTTKGTNVVQDKGGDYAASKTP